MDYSKIYDYLMSVHSYFPYHFGGGKSFSPIRVQLELTYHCNLKCNMCYQDKNVVLKELTTAEWTELIRQLPKACLVTLIGGEPLMRADFREIVEYLSVAHPCNIVTNGVLLSKDINKLLVEKKVVLIGVSLDGTEKVHDQIRGVNGTYQKVIANLNDLQTEKSKHKSKYPLIDIKTVVTKTNLDNLWELFMKVRDLRADYFTVSLPKVAVDQFNPRLKENLNGFPTFDYSLLFNNIDIPRFKKSLKKIVQNSSKTKIRLYPQFRIDDFDRELYNPKLTNKKFFPCRQPWSGVQITANGDVYPCLSFKMGNIREKPFSEIWNSEKFVNFRRDLKKHRLFKDCLGCCYLKQR